GVLLSREGDLPRLQLGDPVAAVGERDAEEQLPEKDDRDSAERQDGVEQSRPATGPHLGNRLEVPARTWSALRRRKRSDRSSVLVGGAHAAPRNRSAAR